MGEWFQWVFWGAAAVVAAQVFVPLALAVREWRKGTRR